jgi:hypothetical protein
MNMQDLNSISNDDSKVIPLEYVTTKTRYGDVLTAVPSKNVSVQRATAASDSHRATPTEPTSKTKVTRNKLRPATRKELAFVKHLVEHPKGTATEAYKSAYNVRPTTKLASLHSQASATMSKPTVVSELAKYSNLIENTLINTVNDWGSEENTRKREIAINTSMFIHDKIHGKATQKIQSTSEVVQISINLTGDSDLPPENL